MGALIYWLINRSRSRLIIENAQAKLLTELKLSQQKFEKIKEYYLKLHKDSKRSEINKLQLQEHNKSLITEVAVQKQRLSRLAEMQQDIERLTAVNQVLNAEKLELKTQIAQLQTLNSEQQKTATEKITLLNEAKTELKDQFKTLANEIFAEKEKKFSQQNKQSLDAIIAPFSQQLHDFRKKVDAVYQHEGEQRASLLNEVKNLKNLNQQLNNEAINLTQALKGDKKLQGTWGELILERVLEQSGLRKGYEYEVQGGFRDLENKMLKPDVIIHLPHNKDIIVDSKVSLVAYEKYASAASETQQQMALKEHITAIDQHLKSLSEKDYSNLGGIKTLDFVLMFVPIEPAFMLAFQHSEKLFTDAFERKIIVVTPTTLLATLKTIESLWRFEKQNHNAREIADKAGNLYDKFRGFIEDIEKLGKQIDTTQSTFHDAINKLTHGKGNLVNQAQQLLNLGVKVKKEIPKSVLNRSDDDRINSNK